MAKHSTSRTNRKSTRNARRREGTAFVRSRKRLKREKRRAHEALMARNEPKPEATTDA